MKVNRLPIVLNDVQMSVRMNREVEPPSKEFKYFLRGSRTKAFVYPEDNLLILETARGSIEFTGRKIHEAVFILCSAAGYVPVPIRAKQK